jgi:hypothetical protein
MSKISPLFAVLLILGIVSCHHRKEAFFSYIEGETGIGGVVTHNGALVEGVEVYLYRNIKSNLKGPADFLGVTDTNGRYFIDVPKGNYFIIARKRKSGAGSGPIRKGDYYSEPVYEPVAVKKGKTAKADLAVKQLFGPLIQKSSGQKKTDTAISGIIVDINGIPIKGVYAFAYKDDDFKREPDYFSTKTSDTGGFTIYFEEGGRYYLGARSSGRGIPRQGELYSFYKGATGSGVFVKAKEKVTKIEIILKEYK